MKRISSRMIAALIFLMCVAQAGDLFAIKELQQTSVAPLAVRKTADNDYFIDFGRDAFGWLQLEINAPTDGDLTVRLGEKLQDGKIDSKPGGSIRFAEVKLAYQAGRRNYRVITPSDRRNTSGSSGAILPPKELGVVLPFRYAEILHWPGEFAAKDATQIMVHYPFDDSASSFRCSDDRLVKVWDLCKYTIKATSFLGIYVDGDRERIPYEGDAYINQLSHYGVDAEVSMARRTHEHLIRKPTWPTEWKQLSVFMAYQDWMYSGDSMSIRRNWDELKNKKVFSSRARADGLIDTQGLRDIVDWPARDGYVMSPINTVVNAHHYRSLLYMAEMGRAIGKEEDAKVFERDAAQMLVAFNEKLFDPATGLYLDGEGINHSSMHANFFPLAFGLVPDSRKPSVIAYLKSRGMACSVYTAQYLLEGLFENGEAEAALALMASGGECSWLHMLEFGSTLTTEAWDRKIKPNLDWNHAWGSAPANIIPRYVLGVRPLDPGFTKAIVAPQLGKLAYAEGVVPTVLGGVGVKARAGKIEVDVPRGMTAVVVVPGTTRRIEIGSGQHMIPE